MSVDAKAAGERIREFRRLNKMSQRELVAHLRERLGVESSITTVSRWERGVQAAPDPVFNYLGGTPVETPPPRPQDAPGADAGPTLGEDAPPGSFTVEGPENREQPVFPPALELSAQAYEKACVDLWQMIGFGVQVAGRGLGNPVVVVDGQIIQAQSGELGKAYGKLAAQNETFRRIIVGLTQGGVWVEVAGATISLAMAIAQNHTAYAQSVQAGMGAQDEPRTSPNPEPPSPSDGSRGERPTVPSS